MEAHRVLARHWRRAEAAWERGGGRRRARSPGRSGRAIDARGVAGPGPRRLAARRPRRSSRPSAWKRPGAGPTPRWTCSGADGRLNDRARAEAEIAAALKGLTGPDWSKVRNFLNDPRSLAFLDRMHRRLEAAEPRREWREAMAWRWWLRHRRVDALGPADGAGPGGGARAASWTRRSRPSYDRVVGGAGGHGPGQQRGGVHEQRAADAGNDRRKRSPPGGEMIV